MRVQIPRRQFISNLTKSLVLANISLYAVGSALKKLDGSLVAGAKTCPGPKPPSVGCASGFRCEGGVYYCDGTTGTWVKDGLICRASKTQCP